MDHHVKSVLNTDRLYWLGRYAERVYTTLELYSKHFDVLIEQSVTAYSDFCRALEIPDIYTDKEDFIRRYAFDAEDPNSINSNLRRAYDNAIELRDEIGSNSLSYIQMTMYEMAKAEKSAAPLLAFQRVTDLLLAFWGCIDDQIDDENTRNILKIGKRVERLDLYARLRRDRVALIREVDRLSGRIGRTDLLYNTETVALLKELVHADYLDHETIVKTVEQIMELPS